MSLVGSWLWLHTRINWFLRHQWQCLVIESGCLWSFLCLWWKSFYRLRFWESFSFCHQIFLLGPYFVFLEPIISSFALSRWIDALGPNPQWKDHRLGRIWNQSRLFCIFCRFPNTLRFDQDWQDTFFLGLAFHFLRFLFLRSRLNTLLGWWYFQ